MSAYSWRSRRVEDQESRRAGEQETRVPGDEKGAAGRGRRRGGGEAEERRRERGAGSESGGGGWCSGMPLMSYIFFMTKGAACGSGGTMALLAPSRQSKSGSICRATLLFRKFSILNNPSCTRCTHSIPSPPYSSSSPVLCDNPRAIPRSRTASGDAHRPTRKKMKIRSRTTLYKQQSPHPPPATALTTPSKA
jgi:hypothetical protein